MLKFCIKNLENVKIIHTSIKSEKKGQDYNRWLLVSDPAKKHRLKSSSIPHNIQTLEMTPKGAKVTNSDSQHIFFFTKKYLSTHTDSYRRSGLRILKITVQKLVLQKHFSIYLRHYMKWQLEIHKHNKKDTYACDKYI